MANVVIDKQKLDILANAISSKTNEPLTLTIPEMVQAVDGIIVPEGTINITQNGNVNVTEYANANVNIEDSATLIEKTITTNGSYSALDDNADGYSNVIVNVASSTPNLQSKTATPTESTQTITPDTGYDGLSSVEVGAISSTYVGSGITRRSSSDLTASGSTISAPTGYYDSNATYSMPHKDLSTGNINLSLNSTTGIVSTSVSINNVQAGYYGPQTTGNKTLQLTLCDSDDLTVSGATVTTPAGYYAEQASKSVASGTAGTPTATKGTVSNHSIAVTPSVTNTTGYITGGTKNGTAVTVSASELVSGTLSITSSGTKDVTNYASASVATGTAGTPSATKGSVSNHSITVTPSVTNTTGYITGGTKTGTGVTVSANELVSGNLAIIDNGTNINVTNYATVSVAVPLVTYYTGSSAPSSSLGSNGDIYLQS